MKIIIAGAGDVGFHLAKLLSYESQDIYVIDLDSDKLNYLDTHLDVITTNGDATSIQTLIDIGIAKTDLLIAVTDSQNTNFTVAAIGKKLGAKKTIARINNPEFINNPVFDFKELGVDAAISPEELAAVEIKTLLNHSAFNDSIVFENGVLNMVGSTLSKSSPLLNLTVQQAKNKFSDIDFIIIAVKRFEESQTIIPRGDTLFKMADEVYFSCPKESISKIHKLIGKESVPIKDVMILGGSKIGEKSAKKLCQQKYNVKLIEKDKDKAFYLAEKLENTLVIQGDGRDLELLEEENIREMDAFIAVTGNSETNIMSCLVAKSKGVKKTIALVENMDYINISQTIGIDTLINKKLLAASEIFKHVRKGEILALANLKHVDAEVLEFQVSPNSKVTKNIIKDIRLSRNAVFGGVIRDGKALMTFGDFQIVADDKVVVFCLPDAIEDVEKLFK
ncbi:MAG: Trk system potassium transporter TrkA [Flavobacteriaceae bacterium]|nr:MAG: Trk system potassium transporter TrkA [Flavobacteriaceae bacterium]